LRTRRTNWVARGGGQRRHEDDRNEEEVEAETGDINLMFEGNIPVTIEAIPARALVARVEIWARKEASRSGDAGTAASLTSFLITVVVESLVLAVGFREFRRPYGLLICFLANLLTHPVYRYARTRLFPHERWLVGLAGRFLLL
jgi:hypothetical protein